MRQFLINPYEAPPELKDAASTPHIERISVLRFACAGLAAGLLSAAFTHMKPLGLFIPPLAFGVAIGCARRLSLISIAGMTTGSCIAWVSAIVASFSVMWLERVPPAIGFWNGAFAGGVGAAVISLFYAFVFGPANIVKLSLWMILVGAVFGGILVSVEIYMTDIVRYKVAGLLVFGWQTAVALTLGINARICRRVQSDG